MRARQTGVEVFYATDRVPRVTGADLADLTREAARTPRQRSRLCTHRDVADALHEMFIVHPRGAYVRPHKHLNKAESMSVLDGEVDLVLFEEDGRIAEVISMGNATSGRAFHYRMNDAIFHTLLIRSEWLVFHEVTSGPFRREDTVFAPWAPDDADTAAVNTFVAAIEERAAAFQKRAGDRA
jgi:cupin fold WbuC family metalloprotein